MDISSIWGTMIPLFVVLLIGIASRISGILDWQTCRKLSAFIVKIAQPCLIVAAFQTGIGDISFSVAVFLALIALIIHIAYTFIAVFVYRGESRANRETLEFGLIFGNITYLGYPLLLVPFPKSGPFYFAVFVLVSELYAQTVGRYILSSGKKEKYALLKSIVNPGTVAALIGILLRILPFSLPIVVTDSLMTVGNLCFPLAMLIVGSFICNQPFRNLFSAKIYMFSFLRLVVLPFVTLAVLLIIACIADQRIDGWCYLIMTMVSLPTSAASALYSGVYKGNTSLAASCVGITSLFSVVTLPFMLWISKLLLEVVYK